MRHPQGKKSTPFHTRGIYSQATHDPCTNTRVKVGQFLQEYDGRLQPITFSVQRMIRCSLLLFLWQWQQRTRWWWRRRGWTQWWCRSAPSLTLAGWTFILCWAFLVRLLMFCSHLRWLMGDDGAQEVEGLRCQVETGLIHSEVCAASF